MAPDRQPEHIVARTFRDLGLRIDERWEAADYDEARFPEIAAAELDAAKIAPQLTVSDVAGWMIETRELPAQIDLEGSFGQPPATVYSGRRFLIQVLLWVEDLMVIHQHSFSGAFLQLHGTGLHLTYTFERQCEVSQRLWLGDLKRDKAELLTPGDVRPITTAIVHANYHLDRPSATVVVRTFNDSRTAPQFFYHPPHVAIDPLAGNAATLRCRQALRFLLETAPDEHDRLAGRLLEQADLHTAVLVLEQAGEFADRHRVERLVAIARRRYGAAVDPIAAVLDERRRQQRLERVRIATADPDLRLLLAVMIGLGQRAGILDMVGKLRPGEDPIRTVDVWLARLRPRDRRLLGVGDAPLPSIAGRAPVDPGLLATLFRPDAAQMLAVL